MKKYLPLLLVVMLAFAGCQREPATYEMTDNPRDVTAHAEKFVNRVCKLSKHYTTEDWNAAIEQFVTMSKNYFENSRFMTEEERMQFDQTRMNFMNAVETNGNEDLVAQVKEAYAHVIE